MNRETRDKFASGTQKDLTTGNACWETAPAVYRKIAKDYGPFEIDICADASRALAPIWFGPGSPYGEDALCTPWHEFGSTGYCNPPYGPFVQRILRKALAETGRGFTSTFLLPMRVTRAFLNCCLRGADRIDFSDKRLLFWENGKPRYSVNKKTGLLRDKPDAAMFDSIIVKFSAFGNGRPHVDIWEAPSHEDQAKP